MEIVDPSYENSANLEELSTSTIPVPKSKTFKGSKVMKMSQSHNSHQNSSYEIFDSNPNISHTRSKFAGLSGTSASTISHLESKIPKMSIKNVSALKMTKAEPNDENHSTEPINGTYYTSVASNSSKALPKNTLKRSFINSLASAIPKPGEVSNSGLQAKSVLGLRNATALNSSLNNTFSSRSHIPPSGTQQSNNSGVLASSFPFRNGARSTLAHRSYTTQSLPTSGNGSSISQYSEDLMNYQRDMLSRQSEEIQELKNTIKKFELDKQRQVDKSDDLNSKVSGLESQLSNATLERLEMEAKYKDLINKAKDEQQLEIMHLKENFHTTIHTKEHEMNKELQNTAKEYEKKFESKRQEIEEEYKKQINELRQMQSKAVENRETQVRLELENKYNQLEKELNKTFDIRITKERQQLEREFTEHKVKLQTEFEKDHVRVTNAETKIQGLELKVDQLRQDKLNLEKSLDNKTNELIDSTRDCADLSKELDETKKKLNMTQNEVLEYKSILDSNETSSQVRQQHLQNDLDIANRRITSLETDLLDTSQAMTEARLNLIKEERLRRKLHNKIQDIKGNLRVYCRVRPLLPHEKIQQLDQSTGEHSPKDALIDLNYPDRETDGQQLCLKTHKLSARNFPITDTYTFEFDKVFAPNDTTSNVFNEVSELVQSALDGYNVCIFAYGQTGSGKTFTMMQPGEGIIIRAIEQIFRAQEEMRDLGWVYEMTGEVLEIYNEKIYDLVAGFGGSSVSSNPKLSIKHNHDTRTTVVDGLRQVRLETPVQTTNLLINAAKTRSTAATCANEHSSRSHSVFVVRLHGRHVGNPDLGIAATNERREGVLNLVDLAGSERLSHSKAQDERLKETQAINKSLSSLVDVISAMATRNTSNNTNTTIGFPGTPNSFPSSISTPRKGSNNNTITNGNFGLTNGPSSFIPFRNSKLTHLLQYSLSGNSKTLMLVNVSPFKDHEVETLRSLRFATMANHTKIK